MTISFQATSSSNQILPQEPISVTGAKMIPRITDTSTVVSLAVINEKQLPVSKGLRNYAVDAAPYVSRSIVHRDNYACFRHKTTLCLILFQRGWQSKFMCQRKRFTRAKALCHIHKLKSDEPCNFIAQQCFFCDLFFTLTDNLHEFKSQKPLNPAVCELIPRDRNTLSKQPTTNGSKDNNPFLDASSQPAPRSNITKKSALKTSAPPATADYGLVPSSCLNSSSTFRTMSVVSSYNNTTNNPIV